jgi:hypothetical protein
MMRKTQREGYVKGGSVGGISHMELMGLDGG